MHFPKTLILTLQFLSLGLISCTGQSDGNDKELGNVNWLRNYDEAVAESKRTEKPILLLFQEVPGCQGCVNYGQTTLTNPQIVEAIESGFVPLAIHNNKGGHDREILKRFSEPAWNFQVMRFIDAEGKDLIPRKDRVWTPTGTATRMIEALEVAQKPVPEYLQAAARGEKAAIPSHTVATSSGETSAELKTAAFSMYCFWDGEAKLGGIEGVKETEAGWLDGREVVLLDYDPTKLEWATLVKRAQSFGCAKNVYAPDSETLAKTPEDIEGRTQVLVESKYRTAKDSDQKRHLRFSKLKELELTPVQRTKINAALSQRDSAEIQRWLNPDQIAALSK